MSNLRDLKVRIGSVSSSEKITGAMKMISSAKMHKAEAAIRRLLPFRKQLEGIIANLLAADADFSSPLSQARADVRHVALVVLGSDDGLCGAYNANIFKQLLSHVDRLHSQCPGARITVIPVGAKMAKAARRLRLPDLSVAADYEVNSKSESAVVKTFTHRLCNEFLAGTLDRVDFVYMKFHSVSRQQLVTDRLLPLDATAFAQGEMPANPPLYIFEPDAAAIFRSVLPLMLLSTVQEIFCENRASEQAARVMAMQSANDNAKKLLDQLQLEFNKLRQQNITTELLDILGGQVK